MWFVHTRWFFSVMRGIPATVVAGYCRVLRPDRGSATAAASMSASNPITHPASMPVPAADLRLESNLTWGARQTQAIEDVIGAIRLWRLAATLGWFDIRLRYRGSMLGPFWLTLSTAVMVTALGVLYSALFKMELHDYLPYLALSLVLWNYLAALVGDACTCFTGGEAMIRAVRMPFTLYAARVLVRNTLVLAHNILVIIAVYAYFDVWPGWRAIWVLPGMAVWMIDGIAACLLLGALCARFRDIPPIVGSLMQIAFFVSPIIWKPELLSGVKRELLPLNPFYSLLELVRAPLFGVVPDGVVWVSALGYSAVLIGLTWLMFVRVRGRLAFWV
jgi:lipopolysaccharide transport system permease protein